jgi:hypothetical protein
VLSNHLEVEPDAMRTRPARINKRLGFESLEQRALLSGARIEPVHERAAALLAHVEERKITDSSAGEPAILSTLIGGNPGHEFAALIEKEVKNLFAVISRFENGLSAYSIPGFTVKSPPNLQPLYTGLPHDSYALQAAGAVALKRKQLELGAIVRGPFTTTPFATDIVFAINRGAGAHIGPAFASRPGITPDELMTVTVGPDGRNNSATLTDLTTGTTTPISAPISVAGPTVRILLPESLLPSKGFALKKYQFAVWTESEANAPIQDVGSFIPENSMIPIGVETNVSATM